MIGVHELSDEVLIAIRDAATEGPWKIRQGSTPDRPARIMGRAETGTPMEHGVEMNPRAPKNQPLIALAPALLDEVLELRAQLREYV